MPLPSSADWPPRAGEQLNPLPEITGRTTQSFQSAPAPQVPWHKFTDRGLFTCRGSELEKLEIFEVRTKHVSKAELKGILHNVCVVCARKQLVLMCLQFISIKSTYQKKRKKRKRKKKISWLFLFLINWLLNIEIPSPPCNGVSPLHLNASASGRGCLFHMGVYTA